MAKKQLGPPNRHRSPPVAGKKDPGPSLGIGPGPSSGPPINWNPMKTQRPLYSAGNFFSCWPCRPLPRSQGQRGIKPLQENLKYRLNRPRRGGAGQPILRRGGRSCDLLRGTASEGSGNRPTAGFMEADLRRSAHRLDRGQSRSPPRIPTSSYVGTGEGEHPRNVQSASDIFKSSNAGPPTKILGQQMVPLEKKKKPKKGGVQYRHMIVHPTNPDVAYAAVLGSAFGPNLERGGLPHQRRRQDLEAGAQEGRRHRGHRYQFRYPNPRILWAALWQARRTPWGLTSGGPGSGLYHSEDGGDTWKKNRPRASFGKIRQRTAPRASGAGSASRSPPAR